MNELPEQKSFEAVSGALRSFNEFINGSSRINSDEPDSISSRKQVVPILNPSFRKLNTFSVQRNYPKSSKRNFLTFRVTQACLEILGRWPKTIWTFVKRRSTFMKHWKSLSVISVLEVLMQQSPIFTWVPFSRTLASFIRQKNVL